MDNAKLNQILLNQMVILTMLARICRKEVDVVDRVQVLVERSRCLATDDDRVQV